MSRFPIELLQAVNDWQRGFDHQQKPKRIAALKEAAAALDPRYRAVSHPCYRQLTLEPKYVMEMGLKYQIGERVSSWTLRLDVAKNLKGGVAPQGMDLLPVILRTIPDAESVVVNIAALFSDPEFLDAVDSHQSSIDRFWDGIGRWRDSQAEVVLELDAIHLHEVFATGGHSSPREQFLERPEVQAELTLLGPAGRKLVEEALANGAGEFGAHWLTGAGKDRFLRKWVEAAPQVREKWRNAATT